MEGLITDKEAAEFLNMSVFTLRGWRSKGKNKLKYYKLGKSVRYRVSDLEEYLDKKTIADHRYNGMLISALPELYAACAEILDIEPQINKLIARCVECGGDVGIDTDVFVLANFAVKKALGIK